MGLEPTSIAALEPKSSMFTNFIIPAYALFTMTGGNSYTEVTAPKSSMFTNFIIPADALFPLFLPGEGCLGGAHSLIRIAALQQIQYSIFSQPGQYPIHEN